nr:type III glutamate--ammonia ligase [Variovorax boronicumulans]
MPDPNTAQALQEQLAKQGVHTVLAQFTDLLGVARGKYVPLAQIGTLLGSGAGFSGTSIAGTGLPRSGARSEYYGRGDPATAQALPWMPGYARVVCDGHVDGEPFEACPRQILRRQVERLAARGWALQVGMEPEFFLLRRDAAGQWQPIDALDRADKPSYDLKTLQRQGGFLEALNRALVDAGIELLQTDHEDAHGQFEVNFGHADVLTTADRLMLFKMAAHTLAERHGASFSMMPKPFANQPGSGMHFHVSLWKGEENLFADPQSDLSQLALSFIAGVLARSAALCALAAPTVNSYKRLVVGESLSGTSWAPAYVAHGFNNRTALVRTLRGRFEWRLPDAAANPYLAAAGLIAAGLDGVDRHLDPGPARPDDLFEWPLQRIRAEGIPVLPQSLGEAVEALERDSVLAQALGAAAHGEFVRLKRAEWTAYARHVSAWEFERYATAF